MENPINNRNQQIVQILMKNVLCIQKVNAVIKELFQSLLSRYQNVLETLMKDNNFIFDCVHLLYYNAIKKFKRGESYLDSHD